jgi:putative FmdB family regulatory protein
MGIIFSGELFGDTDVQYSKVYYIEKEIHMPMYDFVCKSCGDKSEQLVSSYSDKPVCPSCGSGEMEKQLSSFAVSVKEGSSRQGTPGCTGGCCGGSCGM